MFCRDDISLIENYYEAISDNKETWVCHHRDKLRILPSGMIVRRSREELKEIGRYYNCPANELIFMKRSEHASLHSSGHTCSKETRKKLAESAYKQWERQDRTAIGNRISNSLKGYKQTEEHIANSIKGRIGIKWSEESKKEHSIRMKGNHKGHHWKVVNGKRVWYE